MTLSHRRRLSHGDKCLIAANCLFLILVDSFLLFS